MDDFRDPVLTDQGVRGAKPFEAENILKYRQHIFAVKYDENPTMKHKIMA